MVAGRLHFALLLLSYETPTATILRDLANLQKTYGHQSLARHKVAEDYYRIANAAGRSEKYDAALVFYNKAIDLNAEYEEAYLYRGLVYARTDRIQQAVDDFTTALSLNSEKMDRINKQRQPYDSYVFLRMDFDNDLSVLRKRRVEALQLRAANAAAGLNDCAVATADADELRSMDARNAIASQVKAICR
jgi:tetratricopeptide (TPR) repeat protein